jgi:hypothetical protein
VYHHADFTGKVESIWAKDPAKGCWLEDVSIQLIGQLAFLVGRLPPDPRGRRSPDAAVYWYPVDDIVGLQVYDSLEAAWAGYYADQAAHQARQGGEMKS